jgi:transmembrane sensor
MEDGYFSTNEFINDANFRDWVYNPGKDSNGFWADFLLRNPGKETEMNEARTFLTGIKLNVEQGFSSENDEEAIYSRITEQLNDGHFAKKWRVSWISWAAAACLLVMVGWWYTGQRKQIGIASYEQNVQLVSGPLLEKVNQTDTTMLVKLEDGSSVLLKPGSRISYPTSFLSEKYREVYLSGEAFFEVAKDPSKPFLVYANELVTKVVGTSFDIRAFEADQDVTVKVHTGKVAVSVANRVRKQTNITSREADGILVLPNQQAVLSRAEIRLVKALVENPVVLGDHVIASDKQAFVFRSSSAPEVFRALEKAYGVDIQYDATLFDNCQFSADLSEESLYEKLDVICRSLESTYQILDAQIIINGKGCN